MLTLTAVEMNHISRVIEPGGPDRRLQEWSFSIASKSQFMINRAAVARGHEHIVRVDPPTGGHDVIYAVFVGRRAGLGPQGLALRVSLPIGGGNLCLGHLLLLSARA